MDTIEKIYKNIEKLFDVDNDLIDILAASGCDFETQYKKEYLDMLDDIKSLQRALHAILDNHNDTINDIEYALEPLPIKNQPALDAIAESFPPEEIKVRKTNLVEFAGKVAGF